MPKYNSVGIAASLATVDLQKSLTHDFSTSVLESQKQGNPEGSTSWRSLDERLITFKPGQTGCMQFLGANHDLPFFMVEAGEDLYTKSLNRINSRGKTDTDTASSQLVHPTSVSTIGGSVVGYNNAGPVRPNQTGRSLTNDGHVDSKHTSTPSFLARSEEEQHQPFERALALCIDLRAAGAVVKWPLSPKSETLPHLKVEIFLSGDLVDLAFVNKSRNAIQLRGDSLFFQGTRIKRQAEKPWVYRNIDGAGSARRSNSTSTATQRWTSIGASLAREARNRSTNTLAKSCPSAEFLLALSSIPLPHNLDNDPHLATIDVVITTGLGKKYGLVKQG